MVNFLSLPMLTFALPDGEILPLIPAEAVIVRLIRTKVASIVWLPVTLLNA
jgi:hypothetical protein